jgi:hypothetical protein
MQFSYREVEKWHREVSGESGRPVLILPKPRTPTPPIFFRRNIGNRLPMSGHCQ